MECGHQKKRSVHCSFDWRPKQPNGGTTTLLDIEESEFGYNNEQMQPKNWSKLDKNKETNLNFFGEKNGRNSKSKPPKTSKTSIKNETLKELVKSFSPPKIQNCRAHLLSDLSHFRHLPRCIIIFPSGKPPNEKTRSTDLIGIFDMFFFGCFMKICAKKTLDLEQEILEESLRYIVVQLDSPNNAHRVVKWSIHVTCLWCAKTKWKNSTPPKMWRQNFTPSGLPGSNLSIRPKMVPCQVSQLSSFRTCQRILPTRQFSWKERVFVPYQRLQ